MPQVGASLNTTTISEIKNLAEKERRSLSEMIAILIDEALGVRKNEKNTLKNA